MNIVKYLKTLNWYPDTWENMIVKNLKKKKKIDITIEEYKEIIKDMKSKKIDVYIDGKNEYLVCKFWDECFVSEV